ncbi:MAG: hypothetical protein JWQ94_1819, partial [Tardiphaga sp.]|nr:hypothetical protein [Tardiphaga sp.]
MTTLGSRELDALRETASRTL